MPDKISQSTSVFEENNLLVLQILRILQKFQIMRLSIILLETPDNYYYVPFIIIFPFFIDAFNFLSCFYQYLCLFRPISYIANKFDPSC